MSDFVMSSRQAAELDHAFERNGWSPQEVKLLSGGDLLTSVRQVILGRAIITHVIDCDADPFVPEGWKVEEHRKGGQFKWDAAQVQLLVTRSQWLNKEKVIEASDFRKEISDKPVLNANVLDYLVANPYLIPKNWKQRSIFF